MNKLLGAAIMLAVGIGVGGAAAWGTSIMVHEARNGPELVFVPTGPMLAPVTFADGRLSGYVSFEAQVEVAVGDAEDVKKRLPVLLNAINMRTYRTPMASGRDGQLPSIAVFRQVVRDAAAEAYGKDVVRRAVVTRAAPV